VNAFDAVESVSSPTVTITGYPEYVEPNGTYSATWLVTGGDPGVIETTYLSWGFAPGEVAGTSDSFSGTTWAEFSVSGLPSPPYFGTIYLTGYAAVDGTLYESTVLEIPVQEGPNNNFLLQFFEDVQDFIIDDFGFFNFLIITLIVVMVVAVAAAARSKRRRDDSRMAFSQNAYAASNLGAYQQVQAVNRTPPPPPPPPRYEMYVDLVGENVVPPVIKVVEGTKVVWVNRTWAPPPGVGIKSGKFDSNGEHASGVFQSGLLIAPGDYWSCTFHKAGVYDYYVTNIWKPGKVVVEKFENKPSSPAPTSNA
jgi:hypothetical protein